MFFIFFLMNMTLTHSVTSKAADFGFGIGRILTLAIACCFFSERNIRADADSALLHHRFQMSLKTVIF